MTNNLTDLILDDSFYRDKLVINEILCFYIIFEYEFG